jgi:hypothetical protein
MSYDPAEPTNRDVVRGLIGDTSGNPATEEIPDATLNAILVREPDVLLAAAEAADRIAVIVRWRPQTVSIGTASVSRGSTAAEWTALAADLRARAALVVAAAAGSGAPYAGGLSLSEQASRAANLDLPAPFFTRSTGDDRTAGWREREWPC